MISIYLEESDIEWRSILADIQINGLASRKHQEILILASQLRLPQ